MHVPDGFLDAPTSAATFAIAVPAVGLALWRARRELDDRTAPMAGLVAAFVFAGQMITFPVGLGTSGHLLGGALAAVLVGPASATLCLCVVLLVQALLMADGGLTALGTNITLMALIGVLTGWLVFWVLVRLRRGGHGAGRRGPTLCGHDRLASGPRAGRSVDHRTGGGQCRDGAPGSGVRRPARPSRAPLGPRRGGHMTRDSGRAWWLAGLMTALLIAGVASYYASSRPDGLQSVAERVGFADQAKDSPAESGPLAGYNTTGVDNARLSGGLAGVIGSLVVLGLALGGFWVLRRRESGPGDSPDVANEPT
jgi:cobalt/nickel transport system permease protein